MKEYKIGFLDLKWNLRQLLLLPIFVVITVFLHTYVAASPLFPVWFESLCPLFGCCIGGVWYGIVVAVLSCLAELLLGEGLVTLALLFVTVSVVMLFSVMQQMGFFAGPRGVLITAFFCAFLGTALRTPVNLALRGGLPQNNSTMTVLFGLFSNTGIPRPFCTGLAYFLADLADKALVMFSVYGLVRILPERFCTWFSISRDFPQAVVETSLAAEEFSAQKDKLKEKAQEKLDEKKAEQSAEKGV